MTSLPRLSLGQGRVREAPRLDLLVAAGIACTIDTRDPGVFLMLRQRPEIVAVGPCESKDGTCERFDLIHSKVLYKAMPEEGISKFTVRPF